MGDGLTSAKLPVNELTGSTPKESSSLELGSYMYTSYIVTDGVYVAVYESIDQQQLLKMSISIDLSLAKGDDLTSGSFAMYSLLSYFDGKTADDLWETLGMDNPQKYSDVEAAGSNGNYEFAYLTNTLLLDYIPAINE